MRTNKTFSIRHTTLKRLRTEVSSGHRSSFVCDAILNRLDQATDFSIVDIPSRNRAASLMCMPDVPSSIKLLIGEWLTGDSQ